MLGEPGNSFTMSVPVDIAFLPDVDNTVIDNDAVQKDLRDDLDREFGRESRDRYWSILEALREEVRYVDYLGALQRYRVHADEDPRVLPIASFPVDYPFADRVYSSALDVPPRSGSSGPKPLPAYPAPPRCRRHRAECRPIRRSASAGIESAIRAQDRGVE
jgi:hypothetical protein